MDSNGNASSQRKRASRPSKGSSDTTTILTPPQVKDNSECPDVAALATSPTPVGIRSTPAIIPVSECRRSSRKKIIKFDVRDLLNKNRKPHKIQIEARIDSNVPSTSKSSSTTGGEPASNNSGANAGGSGDLSSKQKTFMEKSAIFRRFSISQEQTKPPPPPIPLPPTILSKVGDSKDGACGAGSSGKRINRTQDYYSNVMLKPKQTTSLIVAQMESNVRSVDIKRKSLNKTLESDAKSLDNPENEAAPQQKRRGRPPKTRQQDLPAADMVNDDNIITPTKGKAGAQKLTPEKATNWKEYKACLAQQSTVTTVESPAGNQSTVSKNEEIDTSSPKESVATVEESTAVSNLSDNPKESDTDDIKTDCESINQNDSSKLNLLSNNTAPPGNTDLTTEISLLVENKNNIESQCDNDNKQLENDQGSLVPSKDITKEDPALDLSESITSIVQINSGIDLSITEAPIHQIQHEIDVSAIPQESTAKGVVQPKEKTKTTSRAPSLSESENSERSSLTALILPNSPLNKCVDNSAPLKDPVTEKSPENCNDEENKLPITKRSKRLQHKNIRARNSVPHPIVEDSCGNIQNDCNANQSTSENNSKPSDESNASKNECSKLQAVEIATEDAAQSSIVPNKEIFHPSLSEISNSDSSSSTSENKPSEPNDNSSLSGKSGDEVVTVMQSKENVGEKTDTALTMQPQEEMVKKDECQKNTTSKSKEKSSTKQRKSLRNRKEKNKFDTEKDVHEQSEQKMGNVVDSGKGDNKELFEQVQLEPTTQKNLEDSIEEPIQTEDVKDVNQEIGKDSHSIDVSVYSECAKSATLDPATVVTENEENLIKTQPIVDKDIKSISVDANIDCKNYCESKKETTGKSSAKKSRVSVEKPTSSKRKSLRIQKDSSPEIDNDGGKEVEKDNDGEKEVKKDNDGGKEVEKDNDGGKEVVKDNDGGKEVDFVEKTDATAPQKECPIQPSLVLNEPIEVPKRKPRKSRFKNLHGPDTESEMNVISDKNSSVKDQLMSSDELKTNKPMDKAEALESSEPPAITHIEEISVNEIEKTETENKQITLSTVFESVKNASHDSDQNTELVDEITQTAPKDFESVKNISHDTVQNTELVDEITQTVSKDLPQNLDIPLTSQMESTKTYVIKNVSIETNTLLDILRTVQSNKKAAEKVEEHKMSESVAEAELEEQNTSELVLTPHFIGEEVEVKHTSNSVPEILDSIAIEVPAVGMYEADVEPPVEAKNTTDSVPKSQDSLVKTVTEAVNLEIFAPLEESKNIPDSLAAISDPQESKASQEQQVEDIKLKKLVDNTSKSNSPKRSDLTSPLTLKKSQNSPCRSDTSSPSTLKKVNISPSRSDTSSPSIFNKKINPRRYERRSRRGDDESTHKTLEETFAEIAALSSKAVLEMSTQGTEVIAVDNNALNSNNKECEEKPLIVEEQKEKSEVDDQGMLDSDLKIVNEPETQEKIEVTTPKRKIRQPKTRSGKVQSPSADNIIREDLSPAPTKDLATTSESIIALTKSVEDVGKNEPEQRDIQTPCNNPNTSCEDSFKYTAVIDSALENIGESPQQTLEKVVEESKDDLPNNSSSTSKRIITISTPIEGDATQKISEKIPLDAISILDTTKVEDESKTPIKQISKKKDSSLTKNETKGSNRKSLKKVKSSESIESRKTEDKRRTDKTPTPPPKRGRKAKVAQQELPTTSVVYSSSGGKKKTSKGQHEGGNKEEEKPSEIRNDFERDLADVSLSEKSLDDKMAKKKRQRKLKEAFEAALNDNTLELKDLDTLTPASSPTFGISYLNKSPPSEQSEASEKDSITTAATGSVVPSLVEPEEDPDPLKDIEKFIEDGVNLLKKDYKIDEDSVDNVITSKPNKENPQEPESKPSTKDHPSTNKEKIFNTFETPADTPTTTPRATPPPKSPELAVTSCEEQETFGGVRRSHRIKLITKTPKALVGRGLVRDKERFSIKDDVETKSHYTLDDHLLDLAEVEAKNAKFLKEMEERLSNFHVIKENEYKCERVISKEARKMICDCFLTAEEEGRGELACGEDCLNRLLMIECGTECNVKERCTNKRFQKYLCSPCRVFRTEKKGFGIMADIEILPGEFIMEYVGEVIDTEEFERRRLAYSQEKNRHYYFMALRSDAIIDATIKGNISRFINHSCDPNAETQKWTVNGELRIGFFSRKSIMPGEEITFDYQYQRYGREAQRCYCESSNCRGWIGQEPNSDEGEQIDDDDESDDEEDEEEDTPNLLGEEDEDSDASVSDPEEVQKKLEMAAAQAEAELLAPITMDEETTCVEKEEKVKENEQEECIKPEAEEDSKSKFKKLLSKMAEKVAAKHKQSKKEQKLHRKKKTKEPSTELAIKQRSLEDPDIEDEVEFLRRCGLKTQSDTLRLSRLMVRAKLVQTRLNLLEILRKGELPCRRLFLDYHGLRLVHGWMSEDAGNMQIRLALLQTLELLPIANKTVLTDSKVMQVVRNWCGSNGTLPSPNEDSLSSGSNSQDGSIQAVNNENFQESSDCGELQKLALKLITTWDGLPEIFRIPKKERIEQMKEHEREADRQYAETEGDRYSTDLYRTNRFGRRFNTTSRFAKPHNSKQLLQQNNPNAMRTSNSMTPDPNTTQCLSKTQRREMFAAKVARDEAEKRMAEERREFETKCRFFGLDPKKTRPQDVPFCVNPATGQWYSVERKPIGTPPSYAHVQVPVKTKSTNPIDYQLPPVCSTLPPQWKFAITPLGQIYYYHVQYRVPQWTPPSPAQLQLCQVNVDDGDSGNEHTPTTGPDSSDDDDDILIGMDSAQLKAYIDRKVEIRRQKRYQRLVDERAISPRREEDRIYNQLEVRKYKENKEKIRKRKEEMRRRRAEALRQTSLNMCTLGSLTESIASAVKIETDDDSAGVLPIQDYLLSSDEEVDIKAEVNSPLIDRIFEGDKIVDELDALTTKRPLKRPLPPHRDLNEPSPSCSSSTSVAALNALTMNERHEYKKRKLEKKDKRKPKEQDAKYRRTKEKFRCEIAGIIVHHLKPYRKDSCGVGRIKSNEDFNHLARKLTHFVMIKELKYCESVGQTLVVTESVKNKSREFIKKYMAKYGDVYVKPANDPEFKDIPFSL